MKYNNFSYIYPPRPENAICPEELDYWDNGSLICQPKMDGSNSLLFHNNKKTLIMNRHGQRLTNFRIDQEELNSIFKCNDNEWVVLNAEYLNKNKADADESFNHKLIIFDILVYKSNYLVGSTFRERVDLLDNLYGKIDSEKEYLYNISNNIYRVKSYDSGFKSLYNSITLNSKAVEGVVMKRKNAKLEIGNKERNNTRSQIKCRVKSKNYKY